MNSFLAVIATANSCLYLSRGLLGCDAV